MYPQKNFGVFKNLGPTMSHTTVDVTGGMSAKGSGTRLHRQVFSFQFSLQVRVQNDQVAADEGSPTRSVFRLFDRRSLSLRHWELSVQNTKAKCTTKFDKPCKHLANRH